MSQWIITGYNTKDDGLLYVVEADSEEDAYRRLIELNPRYKYLRVTHPGGVEDCLIYPTYEVPPMIDRTGKIVQEGKTVETDEELSDYIRGLINNGQAARRYWQLACAEVKPNTNLHEAVLW